VIKALLKRMALLAKLNITHSYPHSWRSKAPLIFRTTPQWFIAMDQKIDGKKKRCANCRERSAIPNGIRPWAKPHLRHDRKSPDWCISRQRAWGVPIAAVRQ